MRQEDLLSAINTIQASAQLKDKVLSGKSSGYDKTPRRFTFFKAATYLASAMIIVTGLLFISQTAVYVGKTTQPAFTDSNQGTVQDVRNILLLGVDETGQHSDCIMMVSIDSRSKSERLILTSFPRDLYVDIPGYGKNKMVEAYSFGGAALSVETIKKNFKININDYAMIDLYGLTKVIDHLGGVRVNISEQEAKLINQYSGESKKRLWAGSSVLTGKQASYYSRIRSIDSDLQRMQREQAVMGGMIDQFKLLDLSSIMKLAQDALPLLKTNMDKNMILALAKDAFACRNYPVSYFRPSDDLFQKKQVAAQGSTMDVLVPDLDKYNASLYRFIYQNEAS